MIWWPLFDPTHLYNMLFNVLALTQISLQSVMSLDLLLRKRRKEREVWIFCISDDEMEHLYRLPVTLIIPSVDYLNPFNEANDFGWDKQGN